MGIAREKLFKNASNFQFQFSNFEKVLGRSVLTYFWIERLGIKFESKLKNWSVVSALIIPNKKFELKSKTKNAPNSSANTFSKLRKKYLAMHHYWATSRNWTVKLRLS